MSSEPIGPNVIPNEGGPAVVVGPEGDGSDPSAAASGVVAMRPHRRKRHTKVHIQIEV